ncbi:hypothetical protein DPMN_094455 [Dreissena polymorpha]|uniref:Uncharacterized protein n=1 Tax=Dreissena polymorpha TaxID=45954 RepID=A0A9D4L7G4_DREPO|nr:hypothetical protein DPMN_094455 [Dreissena polymorpha]
MNMCGTCLQHLLVHNSPYWDRQTGLRLTRHQAGLSVQDCSPGHACSRSTSGPLEEKLYGRCKRVDIPSHG